MADALTFLEKRPLAVALVFCGIPYIGLRFYLSGVMHAEEALAGAPSPWFLWGLVGLGVLLPAAFLLVVLKRLVSEKDAFELRALLEIYFSVVLIFAVLYAVLQASGVEPAFSGMATIWNVASPESAGTHLDRLHGVFGNALYLSVVTMTTVGYGDITAIGIAAKALTGLQGLLGIGFVGLVLGQYFSSCLACTTDET